MDVPALMASAGYAAVTTAIAYQVTNFVPEPYMDEIFHIPQAQKYCKGNFLEWDDKITTLPGLYFITVGVLNPLAKWSNRWLCTTSTLRLINVGFMTLTFLVLHKIITQIHGDKHYFDPMKAMMSALNLAFFPLLYFFTFLYYTDVGSTFLVLLMYCLHLDRRDWFASFIGALAVLFRQTNIVWVFFMAVQAAGPHLVGTAHEARLENKSAQVRFSLTTWGQVKELFEGLYLLLLSPSKCFHLITSILQSCLGYIIVAVAFITFVVINDGVVVGDRSAHQVVMHPAQILYFCAFCLCFGAPYAEARLKPFLETCKRHWVSLIVLAIFVIGIVKTYTLAHPYLLADNRHYTFYIWRRIISRTENSPLFPIPLYIFGGFSVLYSIRRADLAFKIAFPLCIVINLLPQYLLEFRYFVIPFLLQRLQIRPLSWWRLAAEMALFQGLNVLTLYLFLFKPFRWEHEPDDVQRFMW